MMYKALSSTEISRVSLSSDRIPGISISFPGPQLGDPRCRSCLARREKRIDSRPPSRRGFHRRAVSHSQAGRAQLSRSDAARRLGTRRAAGGRRLRPAGCSAGWRIGGSARSTGHAARGWCASCDRGARPPSIRQLPDDRPRVSAAVVLAALVRACARGGRGGHWQLRIRPRGPPGRCQSRRDRDVTAEPAGPASAWQGRRC